MTNAITRQYLTARNHVLATLEKNEKGQGTLEYLGMVIVAAVLIIAVVAAFKGANFGQKLSTKINEVKTGLDGLG